MVKGPSCQGNNHMMRGLKLKLIFQSPKGEEELRAELINDNGVINGVCVILSTHKGRIQNFTVGKHISAQQRQKLLQFNTFPGLVPCSSLSGSSSVSFLFKIVFRFISFRCMSILPVGVYEHHVCVSGTLKGQKRVSEPLESELQTIVSCHVSAGNKKI